jgi:hypothetical protein
MVKLAGRREELKVDSNRSFQEILPMEPQKTEPYTTAQKMLVMTQCLRWFLGLALFSALTFWIPLLCEASNPRLETNLTAALELGCCAVVDVLAIYWIYKLFRVTKYYNLWFGYLIFVLFPFSTAFALLFLAIKTLLAGKSLGVELQLLPPRVSAGLAFGLLLFLGCYLEYRNVVDFQDAKELARSGQKIAGTLGSVTRNYTDFIFSGYSFTVSYARQSKEFWVPKKIFLENIQPNDTFTHHEIGVFYLPNKPSVAELQETPGSAKPTVLHILFATIIAIWGGVGLYCVIFNLPLPRINRARATSIPQPSGKPGERTVFSLGRFKITTKDK